MPTQVRTVRQLEFLPDSFDGGASQVRRQQDSWGFVFSFLFFQCFLLVSCWELSLFVLEVTSVGVCACFCTCCVILSLYVYVLYICALHSKLLCHVFVLLLFLQTLGVLSQDGVMRFINIHSCKLLFHIGSHDDAITTVAVSPNGRHVVAIMDNGGINVYSVQSLTQDFNKVNNCVCVCVVLDYQSPSYV